MTDMALIPYADYKAAADQARTLRGTSAAIKSGELPGMLEAANTEVDTQTGLINELIEQANRLPEAGSGGGAEPVIQALEVTENGTYTPPDGVDGYAPVTVAVPESTMDVYMAPSGAMYTPVYDNGNNIPDNHYQWSANLFRGAKNIKDVTLHGWTNVASGKNSDVVTSSSVERLILPDFSATGVGGTGNNGYIASDCLELKEIVLGSVGCPVTGGIYSRAFDGCTNSNLIITLYTSAEALSDVPTGAPWGAKNATIVYRNSTTGEVITA